VLALSAEGESAAVPAPGSPDGRRGRCHGRMHPRPGGRGRLKAPCPVAPFSHPSRGTELYSCGAPVRGLLAYWYPTRSGRREGAALCVRSSTPAGRVRAVLVVARAVISGEEEHVRSPDVWSILRALDCIFVDKEDTSSRQHAAAAVVHRYAAQVRGIGVIVLAASAKIPCSARNGVKYRTGASARN